MPSDQHLFDDAHTTYFWGAKGGVGTTTVAALHALALVRAGHPTTLTAADGDHDQLAALLAVEGDRPFDVNAIAGRHAREACGAVVVIDGGTDPGLDRAVSRRLLVVRACYLALRRVLPLGLAGTDGIVLVEEPQRSLRQADIEDVLGRPVLATVAVTADVARTIDAGLLVHRTPRLALRGPGPSQAAC